MMNDECMIVEEVTGYYHYHIGYKIGFTESLCGKNILMMQTMIPFKAWGTVTHLGERYCQCCEEKFKLSGGELG